MTSDTRRDNAKLPTANPQARRFTPGRGAAYDAAMEHADTVTRRLDKALSAAIMEAPAEITTTGQLAELLARLDPGTPLTLQETIQAQGDWDSPGGDWVRSVVADHGVRTAPADPPVRDDSDGAAVGNQLSAMFVPLANDKKTPLERLRTVTAASASCKGQERAVGYGPMATQMTDALPPAFAKTMIQLGVRSGVLRKLRAGNLMISNVPGPDFPLYFAGMELRAVYPLGPVIDGVALNITVQSYRESLFVGINACASAVPDLPGLTRAMVDELSLLRRMAAGAGEPHRAISTRTGGDRIPAATPGALRSVAAPTQI